MGTEPPADEEAELRELTELIDQGEAAIEKGLAKLETIREGPTWPTLSRERKMFWTLTFGVLGSMGAALAAFGASIEMGVRLEQLEASIAESQKGTLVLLGEHGIDLAQLREENQRRREEVRAVAAAAGELVQRIALLDAPPGSPTE